MIKTLPFVEPEKQKRLSAQEVLLLLCYRRGSLWSYETIKVDTPWGFIGTSGGRRARELASAGLFSVEHIVRAEGGKAEARYTLTEKGREKVLRLMEKGDTQ